MIFRLKINPYHADKSHLTKDLLDVLAIDNERYVCRTSEGIRIIESSVIEAEIAREILIDDYLDEKAVKRKYELLSMRPTVIEPTKRKRRTRKVS